MPLSLEENYDKICLVILLLNELEADHVWQLGCTLEATELTATSSCIMLRLTFSLRSLKYLPWPWTTRHGIPERTQYRVYALNGDYMCSDLLIWPIGLEKQVILDHFNFSRNVSTWQWLCRTPQRAAMELQYSPHGHRWGSLHQTMGPWVSKTLHFPRDPLLVCAKRNPGSSDTPFSDFFPMTHGPYNVTKLHDPWGKRHRAQLYDPWVMGKFYLIGNG